MKKTVAIFFFCLIVCTVSVLFGQQYQSQSIITTEQGLSQNTVRSILLDSRGFLWFATKDGLNKFDGYSFTVYRHSPKFLNSLSNNQVSSLLEDKQGNIWIGTDEGLNKFDPSSGIFSIYLHDTLNNNSISNNSIISLYEDRSGILWIGTRKGLNRFNPVNGSIERVQISLLNPAVSDCSIINSIYQSEDSSLWVGTAACGVFRLDCKTSLWSKVHFLTSDLRNEYNPIVGPIIQDRFGTIWIGTYGGGLFMLDTQKGMLKSFKSGKINPGGIRSAFVTALVHLNDSSIIVICRNTIDILNVRTHSVNSLSMNEYQAASLSLLIDNSGILWIGTDGSGIYKLIPVRKSFRIVRMSDSTRSGLSFSSVRSIYQDSDGELWVGGYIGVNKKQWMHPQETTGFSRNEWELVSPLSGVMPFCFVEDPFEKKELWIGTEGGGVIRFNKQTGIKTIYFKKGTEHFFPSAYCMRILVTRTKKIFFGAKTGLYRWNPDTSGFDSFTHEPENKFSINEGAVKALCEDNEGKLWVGTMKSGISIFNPSTNKFERFTSQRNVPTSLSDNHVNVIYQDAQGTMWVGTSAGLNKFNSTERTFYTYSIADGLPNDCIYGILEDERGNLWLSTNRGISMFNPSTEQFTNYDRFDGLQGDEFNSHAYFKNTRGEMFFGGLNGFTVFFPNEIQFNPTVPNVRITGFNKFNQPVQLEPSIEFINELKLSYSDYVFSFEFTALEFTAPIKNKYAYMMVGFDDAWRTTTSDQRIATYTNLDAGEYVFRVIASNNDGVWNNTGTSLNVVIAPPFWETLWFRAFGIALFVSVVFGMYKFRVNSLHRQGEAKQKLAHQLIESQEAERKRIASEMHDAVGQDLLIIKNLSFMALEEKKNENREKYLQEISETASQTIDDVRKISHNLRPFQIDKLGLAKALESLVLNISKTSTIRFTYDVEEIDGLFQKEQEIHVYRILQECVTNIIKHSDAQEAVVTVRKTNDSVMLMVKDDGRGFPEDVAGTPRQKADGFGLSGLTERVTILNGQLSIASKPSKGTTVSITLPLQK